MLNVFHRTLNHKSAIAPKFIEFLVPKNAHKQLNPLILDYLFIAGEIEFLHHSKQSTHLIE